MSLPSELAKALSAVPCLKCEKPFRLPDNLAEIESLECPHCRENLLMDDILNELAEELQIPTAAVVKAKEKQAAGEQADSEITEAPQIKSHIDEGDYFIPKPLKTAMRRSTRSEADPRRRSKRSAARQFEPKTGGVGEWIRIVMGAVLAIPVAQLVLWWLFAVDPLDMGPRVSKVVPLVVPAALRHQDGTNADDQRSSNSRDMPPSQKLNDDIIPLSIDSDISIAK